MTKGGHRAYHLESKGSVQVRIRGQSPAVAPTEPEYRAPQYPTSPAIPITEDMVREMVENDPEFEQWRFEVAHGVLY